MSASSVRILIANMTRNPDAYHTNYNLVGLSSAQNHFEFDRSSTSSLEPIKAVFNWKCTKTPTSTALSDREQIFNETDRVALIHPVFVVPIHAAENARRYFSTRPLDISE